MPRAVRHNRDEPYEIPQHDGPPPAKASYELPPPTVSDEEMRPRLVARLKSLDTPPMNDQKVARFVDWHLGEHKEHLAQQQVWSWAYDQGLHDSLSFRRQEQMKDAMNDEVFQVRLDAIKDALTSEDEVLKLPGLGLPLGYLPKEDENGDGHGHFPILTENLEDTWEAATLLHREKCMILVVEKLTNKPEWWTKCRDPEVSEKWKKEMLGMDWADEYADFTEKRADAVITELREKANFFEAAGFVPVMDFTAAAMKSDTILTPELTQALKDAVAPLENVPAEQKDWHPGSNNQVLDLVHPSLWPLIYGKTRFIPNKRIDLEECLQYSGTGVIIPKPSEIERVSKFQSNNFQWLPCDVAVSPEGKVKIESYINNLHPLRHAGLYPIIEQFIEKSLPAWDMVYRWPETFNMQRLESWSAGWECTTPEICGENNWGMCNLRSRPLEPGERPRTKRPGYDEDADEDADVDSDDDDLLDDYEYEDTPRGQKDKEWFVETHKPSLPEPNPEDTLLKFKPSDVLSSGFFEEASRIQVIVKLANIELTPESPSYEGGSWHVEGMLNEHICATALYYYDSENITDSHLAFRSRGNEQGLDYELSYGQGEHEPIYRTFAIDGDSKVQDIGSVLTRPGRALFFPNVYQHCVSPFKLADPTKPGHRKILALFLVDPKIPVISTANIAPQQRHWWEEDSKLTDKLLGKLPAELREMVMKEADTMMGLDEAKMVRAKLMEERGGATKGLNQAIESDEFSFCEH